MRRWLTIALLLRALFPLPAEAQEQPQRFRSSTQLVQVSVVVRDERGRPVPGLTAADFQLTEDRKPQSIVHFVVQQDAALGPGVPAGRTSAAFTNVLDGRAGSGATIILLDRLNSSLGSQQQAITHILAFLNQLQPTDRVGLYVLEDDGVRIINDFARDVGPLLTRLREAQAQTSMAYDLSTQKPIISSKVGGGGGALAMYSTLAGDAGIRAHGTLLRSEKTAEMLAGLAQRLAGVRGRKSVVWVSSGFPLTFPDGVMNRNMAPDVYRATRALSQSDIAIYPVDARGLIAGAGVKMSTLAPTFDTANIVAEQTGGLAYRNTNDLATAIRAATEDASLTYVLGYYPTNENWDRRFRRISVKVARKAVTVRHRSGYYGHVPVTADRDDSKQGLFEALARPLEATAVGLAVDAQPADASDQMLLRIRVDSGGLTLERKADRWSGKFELAIAHVTHAGKLFGSVQTTIPVELTDSVRQQFLSEGVAVTRTVTLAADARELLVGVRDLTTGAIGTVSIDAARLRKMR